MRKIFAASIIAALSIGPCLAWEWDSSVDKAERTAQSKLAAESFAQVGMPGVVNFQERRMLKQLYELRDQPNYRTYSYITDLNGGLHKICDSTGYGMPYATQYSNPQKDSYYTSTSPAHLALPQPEPNGLYMPAAADGTWIMCLDPSDKKVKPVFVEPRVIVSPFPLVPEAQKQAAAQ